MSAAADDRRRLVKVTLDDDPRIRRSREVEHERAVAVFDLLEENSFALVGDEGGPYSLHIAVQENRLVLDIRNGDERPIEAVTLPLSPFRSLIRDYFKICEAYMEAIRTASLSRIEAIDMGRRAVHNEGAALLSERLAGRIAMDDPTRRRLFTLICVLHVREWRE
ncbi:MAG: UPF0262 family protein [Alphaproteobacteria bacterium]|nr:UPF0262 family protein [Alphaproteobacteria bacterium]